MKQKTYPAGAIINVQHEILGDTPFPESEKQELRQAFDIAQLVYDLRTARGLTQSELAKLVGTTQPVISRLEDADYKGHSLQMLTRIAAALDCRVTVQIIPREQVSEARKSTRGARKSA